MKEDLKEFLVTHNPDKMPPIMIYGNCLYAAKSKLNLTIDECIERFGSFTIKEWLEILKD